MAIPTEIKANENVTYEKSDIIDISPDIVPIVVGNEIEVDETKNLTTPTQSPNFKAGVSGWRLNSNGIIQAVGVEVTGNISITGNEVIAVANGGTGASTLTGILKGNGTSAVTAITPLSGTKVYYVADSSGGAVTRKLTFTNGILTSET